MKLSKEAKELRAAYQREWREKNKEKSKEYARQWRKKNREKENERKKRWRENNPEKNRAVNNVMQARYWEKKAAAMHQQNSDQTSDASAVESKSE